MSEITSASTSALKGNFPLRKRTGTAAQHLAARAVDLGIDDLRMSERQAVEFVANARWGSTKYVQCAHCGTLDEHYFRPIELRWKCKCCCGTFSVTSGTVLAGRKLPLSKILMIAFSWANGASGKPALQLRRDWRVSYPTVFTLLHKLREGLLRGHNVGILSGTHEMDGADLNGKRYKDKRNRPQVVTKKPTLDTSLLIPQGDEVGPPKPVKYDKNKRKNPDRRIMLVIRQRSLAKGRGGVATRVGVALGETKQTALAMATRYASAESHVISDEDHSYHGFQQRFAQHSQVNHSKEFSRGNVSNNQAESFNRRMRRAAEGIYLNPSNKYLLDYAAEAAWREDVRRNSTGDKLDNLLKTALSVGPSRWWRGFTHGSHRGDELLLEGARPISTRGKPKGWQPKPPR